MKTKTAQRPFPAEMLGFRTITQGAARVQHHGDSGNSARERSKRVDHSSIHEFPPLSQKCSDLASNAAGPVWVVAQDPDDQAGDRDKCGRTCSLVVLDKDPKAPIPAKKEDRALITAHRGETQDPLSESRERTAQADAQKTRLQDRNASKTAKDAIETASRTGEANPQDENGMDFGPEAANAFPSNARRDCNSGDAPVRTKKQSKRRRRVKKSSRQSFPPETLGFYSATQGGFQKQRQDTSSADNLSAPMPKKNIDHGSLVEFPHLSEQTKRNAATSVAPTW